ncbi:MAG: hypothetical protein R3B69_01050 [Candidatus Paceibacterota bacterium]
MRIQDAQLKRFITDSGLVSKKTSLPLKVAKDEERSLGILVSWWVHDRRRFAAGGVLRTRHPFIACLVEKNRK